MKNANISRLGGFTLIELLVVVLIIGILAGVALPQYEVAVKKSRLAAVIPLVKTLSDAEELYYNANGVYTENVSSLDVSMPPGVALAGGATDDGYVKLSNGIIIDLLGVTGDIAGGSGVLYVEARLPDGTNYIYYRQYLQNSSNPGERRCLGHEKVCKSMGGTLISGTTYKLP